MLQRDLNKVISLLLSPQYNRQNPSEKRQTKWVRKHVGNEVRPLKQGLNQLHRYERVLEYSFITADCWLFLAWPPEVSRKETEPSSGKCCRTPRSPFQVLKCSFTFFATTPHRATLENWSMQPQALYKAEAVKAKLLVNLGLDHMLRKRQATEVLNQETYFMFNTMF